MCRPNGSCSAPSRHCWPTGPRSSSPTDSPQSRSPTGGSSWPARVPQMADAEAVLTGLPNRDDVTYIGLVLNQRGFERAAAAGMKEVNVVAVATDTFAQRNQGATSDETVKVFEAIAPRALAAG